MLNDSVTISRLMTSIAVKTEQLQARGCIPSTHPARCVDHGTAWATRAAVQDTMLRHESCASIVDYYLYALTKLPS